MDLIGIRKKYLGKFVLQRNRILKPCHNSFKVPAQNYKEYRTYQKQLIYYFNILPLKPVVGKLLFKGESGQFSQDLPPCIKSKDRGDTVCSSHLSRNFGESFFPPHLLAEKSSSSTVHRNLTLLSFQPHEDQLNLFQGLPLTIIMI